MTVSLIGPCIALTFIAYGGRVYASVFLQEIAPALAIAEPPDDSPQCAGFELFRCPPITLPVGSWGIRNPNISGLIWSGQAVRR